MCPGLCPRPRIRRYAERLPIGLESVIKGVPAATIKAFYDKWYTPDRMAVVVVGDFEAPGAGFMALLSMGCCNHLARARGAAAAVCWARCGAAPGTHPIPWLSWSW